MKGDISPRYAKSFANRSYIKDFLQENNLTQYENLFIEAGFDGPDALKLLKDLTDEDFKEIGIKKLGHRKLLINSLSKLNLDNEREKIPSNTSITPTAPATENLFSVQTRSLAKSTNLPNSIHPALVTRSSGSESKKYDFLTGIKLTRTIINFEPHYFYDKIVSGIYEKLPVIVKFINNEFLIKFFPQYHFELKLSILDKKLKSLTHNNIIKYNGLIKERNQIGIVLQTPKIILADWLENVADQFDIFSIPLKEKKSLIHICKNISDAFCFLSEKDHIIGSINSQSVYLSYNFKNESMEALLDVYSEIFICNLLCQVYSCRIPKNEKICALDYAICAPEVLLRRKFSVGSDVWCMAVFIWEIWNLGATPYITILDQRSRESTQSFVEYICSKDAKKLSLPHFEFLDGLLEKCFALIPTDRPSPKEIHENLEECSTLIDQSDTQ